MDLSLRDAVRAIVLDATRRVLLVRFEFPDRGVWATPGGGIGAGESHHDALRRELAEEVGLLDPVVGPAIWTRTHVFPLSETFGGQREVFYLVEHDGDLAAPRFSRSDLAAEHLHEHRWWHVEELLADSATAFAPRRLAALLDQLLRDGPPREPIDAGV